MIILLAVLAAWKKTRRFAFYFLPWFLFGIIYDSMRLYPNYMVNDIDVANLYHAEKSLFGIAASSSAELQAVADHSQLMIPGEYFKVHHCGFADFWAGIFYLCWVPVPIAFALYLYLTKQLNWFRRFSWAFLLVNVIGFIGYYIYPAAPPWYAMNYGFEAVLNTPGNVAGLGRWDAMTGLHVFHGLYGKNANVFAAVPSLHAAYMFLTTIYAVMSRKRWYTVVLFACICLGIWWTAVYSGHHYIIDVMLGILTTIVGVLLMESKRLWARLKKNS
nr:phosphatase PAP2 family protein [Segatella copri]